MIGPLGSQEPAATLRQHCPQMIKRRCTGSLNPTSSPATSPANRAPAPARLEMPAIRDLLGSLSLILYVVGRYVSIKLDIHQVNILNLKYFLISKRNSSLGISKYYH